MTSRELAHRDDTLAPEITGAAFSLAERICKTEFVPRDLRGKPEATMACVLAGREIGVPPMASLQRIHVIEGRPTLAAELMRGLVLREGHEIWFEEKSSTRVTIAGKRSGSEHVSRITWTMDDAQRAGLQGKNNWRRYPRHMLTARATGELCRDVFPDVIGGLVYVTEELDDEFTVDGVPVESTENGGEPEKTHTRKRSSGRSKPKATRTTSPSASAEGKLPPLPGEDSDDEPVDAEIVEDTNTSKGEGPDGSVPDGDAGEAAAETSGDGADSQDVGRPEPKPVPAVEGTEAAEGANAADAPSAPSRLTPAQKLLLKAKDAGFEADEDRYRIYSLLVGRKVTSGNDLSEDEIGAAFTLLHQFAQGSIQLVFVGDELCIEDTVGRRLLPVVRDDGTLGYQVPPRLQPSAAAAEPEGDAGEEASEPSPRSGVSDLAQDWSQVDWSARAKEAGTKGPTLLKVARRIAGELDVEAPQALSDLTEPALCERLVVWLEEQAEAAFDGEG